VVAARPTGGHPGGNVVRAGLLVELAEGMEQRAWGRIKVEGLRIKDGGTERSD